MVIENTFGIASSRWRILHRPIETSVENAARIVKAVCVLHNYLCEESTGAFNPINMADDGDEPNGAWRAEVPNILPQVVFRRRGANRSRNEAVAIRNTLVDFFNGLGAVSWQRGKI